MSKTLTLDAKFASLAPQLTQAATALGLSLNPSQITQLLYYLQQLLFWNKAYNLTAIKDRDTALTKHVVDSLAIVPHLPAGSLLDIGTGAGLPAVIVAICQPERSVTALDSNSKKIRFIKQVISELGLKNVTPVASRIEDHEGQYQIVTSRAFASLVDFVTLGTPKLAEQGEFWAMKGVEPTDEMAELGHHWQITSLSLAVPNLAEARHLIQLRRAQ